MTALPADGLNRLPEVPLPELRSSGYLHEANRLFFHPLGLALAIVTDDPTDDPADGRLVVLDGRDDPEGVMFEAPRPDLAALVAAEQGARAVARQATLGYVVQPIAPAT